MTEFEVEGEVSWTGRSVDGGSRKSHFLAAIKGDQWYVRIDPAGWAPHFRGTNRVPSLLCSETSCDGTNCYALHRYDSTARSSQLAQRWPSVAIKGGGPNREFYAIWWAYASSHYCDTLTNGSFMGLEPMSDVVKGTIQRSELAPRLPKLVIATNLQGEFRSEYKVHSFDTNTLGLCLPADLTIEYTELWRSNPPWCAVNLHLKRVRAQCSRKVFVLDLNGVESRVCDYTFGENNPPFTAIFDTNAWPSLKDVMAKRKEFEAQAASIRVTSKDHLPLTEEEIKAIRAHRKE